MRGSYQKKTGFSPLKAIVVLLVLAALLGVVSHVSSCGNHGQIETGSGSSSTVDDEEIDAGSVDDTTIVETFELSTSAFDDIPDDFGAFSLVEGVEAPELADDELDALESAIAAIEATADVGFVFLDVDSGKGIAYGADTEIYGASSFKALYALYLCEELVDGQGIELGDSSTSSVESAILYSSNEAYTSLRRSYDSDEFDTWVTDIGASDTVIRSDSHYPWYCARSSARLWAEMYLYLQTGSDSATWLKSLLSQTETSFLRDAISDTDATVYNKAGWCAGSQEKYNSVTDAGIVELDGHTYILCIMTSQSYCDSAVENYQELASALFELRTCLND